MQHQWTEEKPSPITPEAEKQLGTISWVVDTYMGYDENPAHDKAMGQPGVVDVGSTTLIYGEGESGELEAIMDGADKEGRPVVLFMERDAETMEAYSIQDLGDGAYFWQGGERVGPGEGFYLNHYSPGVKPK